MIPWYPYQNYQCNHGPTKKAHVSRADAKEGSQASIGKHPICPRKDDLSSTKDQGVRKRARHSKKASPVQRLYENRRQYPQYHGILALRHSISNGTKTKKQQAHPEGSK